MKKTSLYELSAVQGAVERAIEEHDGDIEAAGVEAILDENYPKLIDKLRAYGWMIEKAQIELQELDGWIDRLRGRRDAVAASQADLQRRMAEGMNRANVKKVEGQDRPLDVAKVVELAQKAAKLKKATDRAQRDQVLEELLVVLDARRPPISWKLKVGRGKVTEEEGFQIEAFRVWAELQGFEGLVVDPEPTTPAPRMDKKAVGDLLRADVEIPGVSLKKEVKVDAGE